MDPVKYRKSYFIISFSFLLLKQLLLDLIFIGTLNFCKLNLPYVHQRFNSVTFRTINIFPLKFLKHFFSVILVFCHLLRLKNTILLAILYIYHRSNNWVLIFDFSGLFWQRFFVLILFYSFESFLLFGGFFVQHFGQLVPNEVPFSFDFALELIQLFFFLLPLIV